MCEIIGEISESYHALDPESRADLTEATRQDLEEKRAAKEVGEHNIEILAVGDTRRTLASIKTEVSSL